MFGNALLERLLWSSRDLRRWAERAEWRQGRWMVWL